MSSQLADLGGPRPAPRTPSGASPAAVSGPAPQAVSIAAADGYPLRAFVWREAAPSPGRPVVVVCAATSVKCRYYFRFAQYLHEHGMDVVAYDYRGIGESRPPRLRDLDASWSDWGGKDCEAVLAYAARSFAGQPLRVVGHSFGGWAPGLAASGRLVDRMFTVGAQYAYWRDYAAPARRRMYWKWHVAMPWAARLWGYFPGRALGWLEDTPAGVARDWSAATPRFEDRPSARLAFPQGVPAAGMRADILAVGLDDDPFGTVDAIERALDYFSGSRRTHLRIAPAHLGRREIGHFAFFHSDFRSSLWPLALAWLRDGAVPDGAPGRVVPRRSRPVT